MELEPYAAPAASTRVNASVPRKNRNSSIAKIVKELVMTEKTKTTTLCFSSDGRNRENTKLILDGHDISSITNHLTFEAAADGTYRAQITVFLHHGISVEVPVEAMVFLVAPAGTKLIEEEPLPDGRRRYTSFPEEMNGSPDFINNPN
jgi:hypothetical protein